MTAADLNGPSNFRNWRNWAGNIEAHPRHFLTVSSEEKLVGVVQQAVAQGRRLRMVGAGHSFTPTAVSDDLMVSLDGMSGIERYDAKTGEATVLAGTRLYQLNGLLESLGRAQENMGDINRQSIAGAISTGTHGTGASLGGVSAQVTGLRIIDGQGQVRTVDTSDPDKLSAARVSLGALGVISAVTLRTVPAYTLKLEIFPSTLEEMLHLMPEYVSGNRHFEFYWIPYTDTVQVKRTNVTHDQPTQHSLKDWFNDTVMENGGVSLLAYSMKRFPHHRQLVSKVMAWGVTPVTRTWRSWEIFGSARNVRFMEMEYALPAEAAAPALRDLRALVERSDFTVSLPIEVRFAHADDVMLSTAYGRDSAYIAIHSYQGVDYDRYFREAEAIFKQYGGRPHWGKWHYRSAEDFAQLYPRFGDFLNIRDEFDPQRVFQNPYLERVLGS